MAKITKSVARHDYPDDGIVKGQEYYHWQLFKQPKRRSLTPPRRSQLTGSAKLSRVYAAYENFHDALQTADNPETLIEDLVNLKGELEEVAEEYRESASNMEAAFPNGNPTIDLCNDYADQLDDAVSEVDDCIVEIEQMDGEAQDLLDACKDACFHLSSPI